jgi:hypothetical protein
LNSALQVRFTISMVQLHRGDFERAARKSRQILFLLEIVAADDNGRRRLQPAQPAASERCAVGRDRPHSTGVESRIQ